MRRYPPLTIEQIEARLHVNLATGRCFWKDATKHHPRLEGEEAGSLRGGSRPGKAYWHIKINGIPYKRSHIVLMVATGRWPKHTVDHKNGDKLDDRADNLRHATVRQNNWNHQRRAKRERTSMGVRRLPSGRFQARITVNDQQISIGSFDTEQDARAAYILKRKEHFGEFA
jgi:hypothetical protein